MLWVVLLCVGLSALVQADDVVRYDNYATLSVGPLRNKQDVNLLQTLVDEDERIRQVIMVEDVISTTNPITLFVHPDRKADVLDTLEQEGVAVEVADENLQKQFDRNMHLNAMAKAFYKEQEAKGAKSAPTYYMRFTEMMSWLTNTANSNSIASRFTLGRSYEGRTIYGLAINDGQNNKPAVWIDAGHHAREWISHATAIYIIDRILTGTDSDASYLRNNFRFYVVPSVNPDGYEYCHTNNRLWRKNRNPGSLFCVGTDPNRNYDAFWGRYGTSTNPCSDTYGGPSAFSEVETRNIRDAVLARNSNMPLLFSLHSYSQLWLTPWSGDLNKPSDYNELLSVANRAAQAAFNVNGRRFQVGTPPDILYSASGGTFDWAKLRGGVKYVYTPELRPASQSQGGFDISPSNILPSGQEIFAAVAQSCRDVALEL